ncbi:MAG: DUF87 domain-containing protein [Tissierellales bacterium]|nr:DUF87 domain-containing protein [Tissierellales bacterium]
MQDYEKLGLFYLGKEYDTETKSLQNDFVLFKSKDLTTHGVIIGMTGSGKTGLGIGILEEAAIDRIPVIVIDPKGDMGNMALTFPEFRTEDFRPWVNPQEATDKGLTLDEYATAQAKLWRDGLAQWDQDSNRVKSFKESVDMTVYTPGSFSGVGVSALKSFASPSLQIRNDEEAYNEKISATATSMLALMGIEPDPLFSREHILISGILKNAWDEGKDMDLAEMIAAIQKPPMKTVGVMDIESFYPVKERFELAMTINSLLASPSFKAWMEGDPMNVERFLYGKEGKPRISIFSIAHLSDRERMFFVTMLLNEILSWVRTQPGTGSLRAILYMDEIFGYLPPTANPPSKKPLLTLLKQARAFGLGLLLSTQNPVDLDYKGLSNAGTWFIGRLQTERDKERVLAGLEGAASSQAFNRKEIEKVLSGLGKRTFYLHSVHHSEPVIFQTRWVLSYLAGPLTRDQIKMLPIKHHVEQDLATYTEENKASTISSTMTNSKPPILPPQIKQVYLPLDQTSENRTVYSPQIIGVADIQYTSSKYGVDTSKRCIFVAPVHDGPVVLDWQEAQTVDIEINEFENEPVEDAAFSEFPDEIANVKAYEKWQRQFTQFLRTDVPLKLLSSPTLKMVSSTDEEERDFRIRLQHFAHEKRDQAIEDMQKKYASKINTLSDRLRRARQTLETKSAQAGQKKLDAAISTGSAILGAFLGRNPLSATSVSKVGTAMKSASRARDSSGAIEQARETLESIENQLHELEQKLQQELDKIASDYNLEDEKLEEVVIKTTATNITVHMVGLAWNPQQVTGTL